MSKDKFLSNRLLHSDFFLNAEESPGRIAIIDQKRSFSYRKLSTYANHIAALVSKHQHQNSTPVGIFLDKGWRQVAACLGILQSGNAFLPISSNSSPTLLKRILQMLKPGLIITEKNLEDRLKINIENSEDINLLFFEIIGKQKSATSKPIFSVCLVSPDEVAYVLFTSGSTGMPKGVQISHKNALNTVLAINNQFKLTSNDKAIAISSLNFDLSIFDIFGLLSVGGTVVFPYKGGEKNPVLIYQTLINHNVTVWNSVPTILESLIGYINSHSPSFHFPNDLRLLLISGDIFPTSLIKKLRKHYHFGQSSPKQLVHLYGVTEASIWSTAYCVDDYFDDHSVPIGQPLSNQQVYILDDDYNPCKIGEIGKLYIAGEGLAKGYWKQPIETQEKFFYSQKHRVVLYDTGDYGRYLPSRDIQYVGRKDNQLKINGNRVELGEIESHIEQHQHIEKAVVLPIKHGHVSKLVAFVSLKENK